jgi:predicted TIM-barrel fold metal-dependent hydrolase
MPPTGSGTTRREWLKQGGVLGLAVLGGCTCLRPSPLGGIPPLRPGALPPPPAQPGSLELPIVIDAHCHIFNVDDVPALPMLKGPVAHALKKFPEELVEALAGVVATIAFLITPSARYELRMLEELSAEYGEPRGRSEEAPSRLAVRLELRRRLDQQMQHFSREFARAARASRFAEQFAQQLKRYADRNPMVVLPPGRPLSEDAIYRCLTDPNRFLPEKGSAPFGASVHASNPYNLVCFAFTLTSPRYLNLAAMQDAYSGGSNVPAIDAFCPSNLDLDHWLGCADTVTTQDDQARLIEQIAILSGGAILPFIGYNPRSDLEAHDRSFERVVDAICNRGFIGVKLYPPMGYLAYGNAGKERPGTCPAMADASDIDARLYRLYAWCADHSVPIMSHTSRSFGMSDDYDDCASPFGWQRAIEALPGLRVQAGHFGGDSDYALANAWAADYVGMMGTPQGSNLYVDLSNLGELFEPCSRVRTAVEPLFARTLSKVSDEIAASRMIYGSDWYMTRLSNSADAYAANMSGYLEQLEDRLRIPGLRRWVFGQNAVKLYGLAPETANGRTTNWDRLRFYYACKKIETPGWMRKLGGA